MHKGIDALYTDRINLLQTDPEEYFRQYPRPRFNFHNRADEHQRLTLAHNQIKKTLPN